MQICNIGNSIGEALVTQIPQAERGCLGSKLQSFKISLNLSFTEVKFLINLF